ncbi:unnamed protein product [Spodoptera exigua]|nr:unnamed protein product [Spodoptera exigua]
MPTKTSTICSKHFTENDFIIKKSGYRYLKPGTIPREQIVQICSSSLTTNSCNAIINKPSYVAISASVQNCEGTQDLQAQASSSTLLTLTPKRDKNLKRKYTEESVMSSSNASTPRKRKLQKIIVNKECLIKKQRLKIRRIQAQNRRLKKKFNKMQDVLNDLQKNFHCRTKIYLF